MVIDLQNLIYVSFLQKDLILYLEQLSNNLINYVLYYYQAFPFTRVCISLGFYGFILEFYQQLCVVKHSIDVVLSSLNKALGRAILGKSIRFCCLYYNAVAFLLLLKCFKDLKGVVCISNLKSLSSFKFLFPFLALQYKNDLFLVFKKKRLSLIRPIVNNLFKVFIAVV